MKELVELLLRMGVLKTPLVEEALWAVDRADFVPPEYHGEAYGNYPLPIGYGQTISQPYVVAFMLELLGVRRGERVLDVGSGSGWTTALLAHMVGGKGEVFGLEIVPELVSFGQRNLNKYPFSRASISQAGKELGLPKEAPFDRILVSAASSDIPKELVEQLKIGGVMVLSVKDAIFRVEKKKEDNLFLIERRGATRFVVIEGTG